MIVHSNYRAFRLREGVEGAFEGSQGVRAFDRLHDALFGAASGDRSETMLLGRGNGAGSCQTHFWFYL